MKIPRATIHRSAISPGLPMTPQALAHADTWTESRLTLIERQCVPNGASWAFRGPAQIRIWEEKDPATQDVVAIKTFISTFSQTRTIWMDGRPHPGKYAPHTWQGFSTGKWEGSMLTVRDDASEALLPSSQRRSR